MTPADTELISRVLAHDDRVAFGELVRRHQSAVRGFLRQLAHSDNALADDLAQETFIQAYRRLARFRGDSRFSTWLLGIAHNQFRNSDRLRRRLSEVPHSTASEQSTPSAVDASDLREDLATAMRTLSADEQLALHLGYAQGLSHTEIATLVDWPLGTVKTHLARSKEKLRTLLAAWNPQT